VVQLFKAHKKVQQLLMVSDKERDKRPNKKKTASGRII